MTVFAEFENLWDIDPHHTEDANALPPCYAQLTANRDQTVCFTGHRSIPPTEIDALKARLLDAIRARVLEGYTLFLTGGALGFDTLAHEAVIEVRREYPFVRAIIVIPCLNQAERWPTGARDHYCSMIESADGCLCLQEEYTADCMRRRNCFMIDHSACCIAYYSGREHSGTGSTVGYAAHKGIPVQNIHPAAKEQLSLCPANDALSVK